MSACARSQRIPRDAHKTSTEFCVCFGRLPGRARSTRKAMTARGMRSAAIDARAIDKRHRPRRRIAFKSFIGLAVLAAVVVAPALVCAQPNDYNHVLPPGSRPRRRYARRWHGFWRLTARKFIKSRMIARRSSPPARPPTTAGRQAAALEQRPERHRVLRFRRVPAGCSGRIAGVESALLCPTRQSAGFTGSSFGARKRISTGDRRRCRTKRT